MYFSEMGLIVMRTVLARHSRELPANLASCNSGNIAITFALSATILFAAGGVATDPFRVQNLRSEIQARADASVMAAAIKMDLNQDERAAYAKRQFEVQNTIQAVSFDSEAKSTEEGVTLRITGRMPTTLLNAIGISAIDIDISSAAAIATPKQGEVALVLDYSGSMQSNNKYVTMSRAASDLVTELLGPQVPASARDRMKISLVPFSEYVYADMATDFIRGVHPNHFGRAVRACLDTRRYPFTTNDSTPDSAVDNSRWPAPGMPKEYYEAGPITSDINGSISYGNCNVSGQKEITTSERVCTDYYDGECENWETVTKTELVPADECSRTHSVDEKATQDTEGVFSDFASSTPQCQAYRDRQLVVKPLTNDRQALLNALSAMRPLKLTDISLGLQMGWHMLSPNAPFGEGAPYNDTEVEKTIVLLTDGRQTVGGFGPYDDFSIDQANANTLSSCTNIKAKGVKIITVAFDLDDQATKNMLMSCASHPSKYFFDAANTEGLLKAFEDITRGFQSAARLLPTP